MKRNIMNHMVLISALIGLSGCTAIGEKSASMSGVYFITALISVLLLMGYCTVVKKKEKWMLLLLASVAIVNIGYYALSVSKSLEQALWANRCSYFGSVFLPMAMLMIIVRVTKFRWKQIFTVGLLLVAVFVFLVAASPGYLDIYYKEVSFEIVNGVSILNKVYGSWHRLYLFYLLSYYGMIVGVVITSILHRKMDSAVYAALLVIAVSVNLGVWMIEQLVKFDFEILSISYIISELFLLGLDMLMNEQQRLKAQLSSQILVGEEPVIHEITVTQLAVSEDVSETADQIDRQEADKAIAHEMFLLGISSLTKTERAIYDLYIEGKTTKEIMAELNIKENTLKFHNKNLYSKLGVSSRKQLMERYKEITLQRIMN